MINLIVKSVYEGEIDTSSLELLHPRASTRGCFLHL